MSNLTHVEVAIGEDVGTNGMMTNVCRVFNDNAGVELVERTGRNPCYEYLQLGCSQRAVQRMLHYAKTQCVDKPFSNYGMARSVLWPWNTDGTGFLRRHACSFLRCPVVPVPDLVGHIPLHRLLAFCCVLQPAQWCCAELGMRDSQSRRVDGPEATLGPRRPSFCTRCTRAARPAHGRCAARNGGAQWHRSFAHGGWQTGFGGVSGEKERESLLQQRAVLSPMPAVRPERLLTTSPAVAAAAPVPSAIAIRVIASGAGVGAGMGSASRPMLLGATAPSGGRGLPAGCAGTTSRPSFNLTLNSLNMNAVQRTGATERV